MMDKERIKPLLNLLDILNDVFILMITKVLVIAPVGVFADGKCDRSLWI